MWPILGQTRLDAQRVIDWALDGVGDFGAADNAQIRRRCLAWLLGRSADDHG